MTKSNWKKIFLFVIVLYFVIYLIALGSLALIIFWLYPLFIFVAVIWGVVLPFFSIFDPSFVTSNIYFGLIFITLGWSSVFGLYVYFHEKYMSKNVVVLFSAITLLLLLLNLIFLVLGLIIVGPQELVSFFN